MLLLCAAVIVTLSLVGVARLATENAASEGARTLSLTNDDERARGAVEAAAKPLRTDRLQIEIAPTLSTERPRGTLVRVAVRYQLEVPFAFVGVPSIAVEGAAARRMEYVP